MLALTTSFFITRPNPLLRLLVPQTRLFFCTPPLCWDCWLWGGLCVGLDSAGGKGTARRKVIKKSVASLQADDKKVHAALKKLNVTPLGGVEEVNMFQEDGNVLHFSAPAGASLSLQGVSCARVWG